MKYHLTTVSVSGPLVKGEYASELFHVFDISEVHDWLPISWIEILYSRMISPSTYMMTGSGTLNPTIRANRKVVVRQYTRGLRIALELNDVLLSAVRAAMSWACEPPRRRRMCLIALMYIAKSPFVAVTQS